MAALRDLFTSALQGPSPAVAPLAVAPLAADPAPRPLDLLRARVARIERAGRSEPWGMLPFGDPRIDDRLGGGLARGAWHEIGGEGLEREAPAAAAGFCATLAARLLGPRDGAALVWALAREDVFAHALPALDLDPGRVIFVRAGRDAETFAVAEDALRTRGVGAVIAEAQGVDLVAGRRLQLACAEGGGTAFVLRRAAYGDRRAAGEHPAAATRWRIGPAPTAPDGRPGLGPPRWRAALERSRTGRLGQWILETGHDDEAQKGALRVVAQLADHPDEAGEPGRLAAGRVSGGGGAGCHAGWRAPARRRG